MMKSLRSLPLLALTAVSLGACTSIDCSISNVVAAKWQLRTSSGTDTLKADTLTVYTQRADGQDTVLFNRGVGITSFTLPMSHTNATDVLYLHLADTTGQEWNDTITLEKSNELHIESVECSPQYYHTLSSVSHTTHIIDSIVINNANVNNNATLQNLYLYLRSRH